MVAGIDEEDDYPYREGDEFMPRLDEDDALKDHSIKLSKGESTCVQIIDPDPERRTIARHWWHSVSIVCPALTSKFLLTPKDRKPDCPLCQQGMKADIEWHLPVLLLAVQKPGLDWEEKEPHQPGILRLKLNWKISRKAMDIFSASGPQPTLVYGRKDDSFGTYFLSKAREQEPPLKDKSLGPALSPPFLWSEIDLIKFAATVKASQGIEPQPGRVRKYDKMFTGCPLIGLIWGTKKPIRTGFMEPKNLIEWMMDQPYLDRVDRHCGIMVRLEIPLGCVDLDRDQDIAEFLMLNPWAEETHRNKGGRGGKFFAKINGEYPSDVLDFFDGEDHVGEFRGAGETAIIDGLHPSGKLYETLHEGQFAEIKYTEIVWPKGWKQKESSRKYFKGNYATVEGGLLDLAKLKNVHPHPSKAGALQAQCPACAENGSDESGNHLIIYDGGEGRYGCAVDQSAEHYSLIFKLAKRDDLDERRKPEPFLDLPKFVYERKTEKYWQQDVDGIWQGAVHGQAMRLCAAAGLSRRPPKGGALSAAEAHLVQISQEAAIDYAGPLAGHPAGVYNFSGHKILVTRGFKLIEAEEGEWETIKAIVNGMFGPEQKHYLYATLKYGYEAYRDTSSQPVPMITLCGPGSGDNSQECAVEERVYEKRDYSFLGRPVSRRQPLFDRRHRVQRRPVWE